MFAVVPEGERRMLDIRLATEATEQENKSMQHMMNSAAVETVFESRDRGTLTGFQSPTFVIDTSKYLPWLMRKLEALTKR